MTVASDLGDDYKHYENPQIVTVIVKESGSSTNQEMSWDDNGTTRGAAIKADSNKARRAFGGVHLQSNERAWLFPDALMGGKVPTQGDEIAEDAEVDIDGNTVRWTIQEVQQVKFDTEWLCRAKKQR